LRRKRSIAKKLPSNVKAKGIVGKPAEPTFAPGGRVAAAAWVAGAGVAAGCLRSPFSALPTAAVVAAGGAGEVAAEDAPPALTLIERKSMSAPSAALSSW
jgi:hypothetical protein